MGSRNTGGFTVIELIVTLAIVAVSFSLMLSALRTKEEDENLKTCTKVMMSLLTASTDYARDQKESLPNGMNSPWVKGTFIGTSYYAQSTLDPAQICGIGQLMEGNYIAEKREAISCPQTDLREDKGFNGSTWMPLVNYSVKAPNDASDRSLTQGLDPNSPWYYRNISKQKNALVSTYAIRGPAMRTTALTKIVNQKPVTMKPFQVAFFADHEGADQKLIPEVEKNGKKPIDGWGRVHREGLNVGYLDVHVEIYQDEDRAKTWAMGQVRFYGTSSDMYAFDLEGK